MQPSVPGKPVGWSNADVWRWLFHGLVGGLVGWGIYSVLLRLYLESLEDESSRLVFLELSKTPFAAMLGVLLTGSVGPLLWMATSLVLTLLGVFVGLRWPLSNRSWLASALTVLHSRLKPVAPISLLNEPTPPPLPAFAEVITVHGTFASRVDTHGDAWWQLGNGIVCQKLTGRGQVGMCGVPFQWSGKLQESERDTAADGLAARILKLENQQRPYHLVGHSLGGSVIWKALRIAEARKRGLPQLRSWTTVGTPFLQFGPAPFDAALLIPFFLLVAAFSAASPFSDSPSLRSMWKTCVALAPNLGPDGGEPALAWAVMALIAILGVFLFMLAARSLLALTGFVAADFRHRAGRRCYAAVGARHLAIFSRDDEAIAGLTGSVQLGAVLVPSLTVPTRGFLAKLVFPLVFPFVDL